MIRTFHDPDLPASEQATYVFRYWPAGTPFVAPKPGVNATVTVTAIVNHGRWVALCPCGGAQLLTRTDYRMFCVECMNQYAGGQWVRVEWPPSEVIEQVEAQLCLRPFPQNRNWQPGEKIVDLFAENVEHGAIDPKVVS